ncbi:MAG: ROK domain containing protein [Candidatus Falkowbacteria bacterium GW2011_GWC2_38_22]|uniref:ROK domain containing protein n=1 Tax=Candidatus Falkowbacteria bacterium GW2011_GWE1_38_31 TaxID=1618638 RepID=A0A0G0JS38_9BACT|nr:MAG: ROK domain containing protein [Candidatus Falkowbacteria bacterium GW2011_GWF2_38_1205]KKQ60498.1 MAG: ROK domain containing protein [Candidatus Falkowbacteria bacterium GW2011_GWC2_38_22]KKQ62596.1 MAG: ROK domain containing protein [Candidatus Falkowbacteria bacterium GW2011_GWF1_38_22]KKQ64643.1 MAG: ROK domain containing protein [Candidatus Falkowbacteria bacterium GW2011_GWE2_38_254]KKQ69552.1 MAG: ROK domain containing protein [Candidatus Falkowbacteria bacterium GW2011_GWE1_38_31
MSKSKTYTIGIDVGGTKISAVLFDGEKVVMDYMLATPKDNLEHFLIMVKAVVDPLLERAREMKVVVNGVGAGIAGVFDASGKKMLFSPNIPTINNVFLGERIEKFIGMPVLIDNDAKCFVRAEALIGAGKNYKNVFGLIVGTGIGGGWWINGDVYNGSHRGASEVDAMIIDSASGLNLEQGYHKIMQNNPGKMSQEAIIGDPLAEQVYNEFGRQLGIALANISNLIDPEIFVLGGGAVASSDLFLSIAKKEMKEHINSSDAAKKIKIVKSKLGANAGAIGAALLCGKS